MHRHRNEVLWLDTELFLLHGSGFASQSVFQEWLMLPANQFTRAVRANQTTISSVSQVEIDHVGGNILWILDLSNHEKEAFNELLDFIAFEAGLRKLHFLKATVSNDSLEYKSFIRAGYISCGSCSIFSICLDKDLAQEKDFKWRRTRSEDEFSVSILQKRLLSAFEKRTKAPINKRPPGFVLLYQGEIAGYADVRSSNSTVVITPVLAQHISSASFAIFTLMNTFFNNIPNRYLVLSASQNWIKLSMGDQIKMLIPQKELMFKPLTITEPLHAVNFEQIHGKQHTDIATPIRQINKHDNNI